MCKNDKLMETLLYVSIDNDRDDLPVFLGWIKSSRNIFFCFTSIRLVNMKSLCKV